MAQSPAKSSSVSSKTNSDTPTSTSVWIKLLASYQPLLVPPDKDGDVTVEFRSKSCTIRQLKEALSQKYQVPINEQYLYEKEDTSHALEDKKSLDLDRVGVGQLKLVIRREFTPDEIKALLQLIQPPPPVKPADFQLKVQLITSYREDVPKQEEFTLEHDATIETLKSEYEERWDVPTGEQHFYLKQLTLEEVKDAVEAYDNYQLSQLKVKEVFLIIKPSELIALTEHALQTRLPHIGYLTVCDLFDKLQQIPIEQLDLNSIREGPRQEFEKIEFVRIFNRDSNKFVQYITVDEGENLHPYRVIPVPGGSNLIEFRGDFTYEYSSASVEYVQDVMQANIKYEEDLFECKKKLDELPFALIASEAKLKETFKIAREKSTDMDTDVESVTSALGKLVLEQSTMQAELDEQKARLPQLKRTVFDPTQFTRHQFQSSIKLEFGCHEFAGELYELIQVHPPKNYKNVVALEPDNQMEPVAKKCRIKKEEEMKEGVKNELVKVEVKVVSSEEDEDEEADEGSQPGKEEDGEMVEAGTESPTKAA